MRCRIRIAALSRRTQRIRTRRFCGPAPERSRKGENGLFAGSDSKISLRYAQCHQRQNVEERCRDLEKYASDDRTMHLCLFVQRSREQDILISSLRGSSTSGRHMSTARQGARSSKTPTPVAAGWQRLEADCFRRGC